jgi:tetratricopeptide (TPR) repeat protein
LLPGCTRKQVLVSAPQEGKNFYKKSSPKRFSDQIRSVFKVSEINRWAKKRMDRESLLERYPEVIPTLAQVERDPTDLGAKRRLAEFFAKKKLYRRALKHFTELAVLLPDDEEIQLTLGRIWDYQGAHAIALRHAINAVEINPESVPAHTLLGTVYLHREEPEKAAVAFQSVLELDPDNTSILANIGYAYLQLKDWQSASKYLEIAIQNDPESTRIRNNLGIAKAYLGDEEGAIQEFLKVSEPAVAYNNLGAAYLAHKHWSKARDAFEKALAWDPRYVKARLNLMEAESYLPPPSAVDLPPSSSRFAWLQTSWEEYYGINSQNIISLPRQQLFHSTDSFPFPLQRLGLPPASAYSDLLRQVPHEPKAAKVLPVQPAIQEPGNGDSPTPETHSLAELAPLPFTVEDASASPQSARSLLALASVENQKDVTLPSPVEMADLSKLLSHVVAAPLQSLRHREESLEDIQLAGGNLLEMLVRPPSGAWAKIALPPKAGFGPVVDETVSGSYQVSYPAQVWLAPKSPAPKLPDFDLQREEQSSQKMGALRKVSLPFQLPRTKSSEVNASVETIQKPEKTVAAIESTQTQLVLAETDTSDEISTAAVRSIQPEDRNKVLSFDQFTLVREQVFDSQVDRSNQPQGQASEASKELPVKPSGLAGLAGAALILFSLGTTRLFLRWRSPFRGPGKPEPEEED